MSRDHKEPGGTGRGVAGSRRLVKLGAVLAFYLLTMFVLYAHLVLFPREYGEGQIVPYTVLAPVSFVYEDSELLESLRGTSDYKVIDQTVQDRILKRFNSFRSDFFEMRHEIQLAAAGEGTVPTTLSDAQLQPYLSRIGVLAERNRLDGAALKFYLKLEDRDIEQFFGMIEDSIRRQMQNVVTAEGIRTLRQGGVQEVYLNPTQLYSYFLEPNVVDWSPPEISAEQQRAASMEVQKGSLIISEGTEVTRRSAQQLSELRESLVDRNYFRFIGAGLLLAVLLLLWQRYLRRYTPSVLERSSTISQLCGLWLFFLCLGLVIGRLPFDYFYYGVTFAVSSVAIVVVLMFDPRFALVFATGLALMLSIALSFSSSMTIYTIASAMLPPVLLYTGCQRRIQVVFALKQGIINMVLASAVMLILLQQLEWRVLAIAAIAGIGAAVVALGLLPVIETITAHLTPGKLTDLLNHEHDLLKRLKREAHGTYVHSVIVADLVEEGCRSIGANWLIAKVGALYHDIGKLKRPAFFAENILDLEKNPHKGLPPETSARIITDHVKDGIAMAREARLPYDLLPFIAEHHGNYVIRFFYHKACKLHEEDPDKHPRPSVDEFRYDGPLPKSRESGVLMLADVSEAVVRASTASSAEELGKLVDEVIAEKLREGQLVKSGLTVGDLALVRDAFVELLAAQRHARVSYPEGSSAVDFHHGRPKVSKA